MSDVWYWLESDAWILNSKSETGLMLGCMLCIFGSVCIDVWYVHGAGTHGDGSPDMKTGKVLFNSWSLLSLTTTSLPHSLTHSFTIQVYTILIWSIRRVAVELRWIFVRPRRLREWTSEGVNYNCHTLTHSLTHSLIRVIRPSSTNHHYSTRHKEQHGRHSASGLLWR